MTDDVIIPNSGTPDPNLPPDFNDVLNQAEGMTDQQFGDIINSYTKLTAQEITDLQLTDGEKAQLVQLIQVVNSKTAMNERISAVIGILGSIGSVVVKLAIAGIL
jgi:hypothetical protein